MASYSDVYNYRIKAMKKAFFRRYPVKLGVLPPAWKVRSDRKSVGRDRITSSTQLFLDTYIILFYTVSWLKGNGSDLNDNIKIGFLIM